MSTREPNPTVGALFALIRSHTACAWAIHQDVPESVADQFDTLARTEPPPRDLADEPVQAARYHALAHGRIDAGPVFTIPSNIATRDDNIDNIDRIANDIVTITDISQLEQHFRGWKTNEISGCSPILAIVEAGHAVSVCFCARRSAIAAEAGLETAAPFRGRGLGPRVTAAWARAIQTSGRLPFYSTSWSNTASLGVARKLGLVSCASDWTLTR